MSRGYTRQTGFSAREDKAVSDNSGVGRNALDSLREPAVAAMVKDAKARETFSKLLSAIAYQQIMSTQKESSDNPVTIAFDENKMQTVSKVNPTKDDIKKNKLEIARLVQELPAEVRQAIEVRGNNLNWLVRGVKDENITEKGEWRNGNFVYGFAEEVGTVGAYKGGKLGRIISLKNDVESFKGAIDLTKVYYLAGDVNKEVWNEMMRGREESVGFYHDRSPLPYSSVGKGGSQEAFDAAYREWDSKRVRNSLEVNGKEVVTNPWPDENEVLVYGIKFKKTGGKFYGDKKDTSQKDWSD